MPVPCQVAVLTPTGKGAVATVCVTGADAVATVGRFVRPLRTKRLIDAKHDEIVVAQFVAAGQTVGEELVVTVLAADHVLLHPHGGLAAVEAMVATFETAGCTRQSWQDYLRQRADDPWEAEASILLTQARTLSAARLILDQQQGAMRRGLAEIKNAIQSGDRETAKQKLLRLQKLELLGKGIAQGGFRLVVAGRPNVGKSRLINRWLGYERSIVFDQPGTTRDIVETPLALGGWPFMLMDTAGLRETEDPIESEGVQRANRAIQNADLVLLLFDGSVGWTAEDARLQSSIERAFSADDSVRTKQRLLVVQNKSDLLVKVGASEQLPGKLDAVAVSAQTGMGMEQLEEAILNRLVPITPNAGEAVPVLEQQRQAVDELWQLVAQAD